MAFTHGRLSDQSGWVKGGYNLFLFLLMLMLSACLAQESFYCESEQAFTPTDIRPDLSDGLFLSDAEHGNIFYVQENTCTKVATKWSRPFGLATLLDGRLCASHFTSDDPAIRQSAVSCWDGKEWQTLVTGLGNGINGLLASEDGLWVLSWLETDVEQRDGLLSLVRDSEVVRQVELQARVPQFATVTEQAELYVTTWREDASGVIGSDLIRVTDKSVEGVLRGAFKQASGMARSPEGLWIADAATGELSLLSQGRRLITSLALAEPMGIMVNQNKLCIAESARNRIICLEINDIEFR